MNQTKVKGNNKNNNRVRADRIDQNISLTDELIVRSSSNKSSSNKKRKVSDHEGTSSSKRKSKGSVPKTRSKSRERELEQEIYPIPEQTQHISNVTGTLTSQEEEELDYNDILIEGGENQSQQFDGIEVDVHASDDLREFPEIGNSTSHDEETVDEIASLDDTEVTFKRKTEEFADFKHFEGDPAFHKYISKLVAQEVQKKTVQTTPTKGKTKAKGMEIATNQGIADDLMEVRGNLTPAKQKGATMPNMEGQMIKSPSDTTIYAPALGRATLHGLQTADNQERGQLNNPVVNSPNNVNLDNQISQFIEGVRLQSAVVDARRPVVSQPQPSSSTGYDGRFDESVEQGKRRASNLIVEAEKFKATVNNPPGMQSVNDPTPVNESIHVNDMNQILQRQLNYPEHNPLMQSQASGDNMLNAGPAGPMLDIDDQFFHVTCHVDQNIKSKIQRGEFVDLERLLPRNRNNSNYKDNKMDLIFKDGRSYFVPAGSNDSKILGVRRWEQAFRVYAAIYSEANPGRAAEIWQYVHIINMASSTYTWENVSNYDVTFRHLMAANPHRSWAKIYQQMWSLSMRDFVQRNYVNNGPVQRNGSGGRPEAQGSNKKIKYCWAFNRGNCKEGLKCKFVNRCSICDSSLHGKNSCDKKN